MEGVRSGPGKVSQGGGESGDLVEGFRGHQAGFQHVGHLLGPLHGPNHSVRIICVSG